MVLNPRPISPRRVRNCARSACSDDQPTYTPNSTKYDPVVLLVQEISVLPLFLGRFWHHTKPPWVHVWHHFGLAPSICALVWNEIWKKTKKRPKYPCPLGLESPAWLGACGKRRDTGYRSARCRKYHGTCTYVKARKLPSLFRSWAYYSPMVKWMQIVYYWNVLQTKFNWIMMSSWYWYW